MNEWPQQLVGARMNEVVQNINDKVEILDLIRLVLRDSQERVMETTVWTPGGNVYRRLTIHWHTKASVTIIATKARDNVPQRDPPGNGNR